MRTIHKQILASTHFGIQYLSLPVNFKILHLEMKETDLCLWYECATDNPHTLVEFRIYATGDNIGNVKCARQHYVGTCILHSYVYHVYRVEN